jgi:hypothetical protein
MGLNVLGKGDFRPAGLVFRLVIPLSFKKCANIRKQVAENSRLAGLYPYFKRPGKIFPKTAFMSIILQTAG